MESNRKYPLGKFKVVIGRVSEDDQWEILKSRFWCDGFDYSRGALETQTESYSEGLLRDMYILGEAYTEELKDLAKTGMQVFEIVGELHEEASKYWTDYGYEYDSSNWFENTKVQEITGEPLEWFKEDNESEWKEFTGESSEKK